MVRRSGTDVTVTYGNLVSTAPSSDAAEQSNMIGVWCHRSVVVGAATDNCVDPAHRALRGDAMKRAVPRLWCAGLAARIQEEIPLPLALRCCVPAVLHLYLRGWKNCGLPGPGPAVGLRRTCCVSHER